jgi:hypothetical protein
LIPVSRRKATAKFLNGITDIEVITPACIQEVSGSEDFCGFIQHLQTNSP